jgi:hypothetical protein
LVCDTDWFSRRLAMETRDLFLAALLLVFGVRWYVQKTVRPTGRPSDPRTAELSIFSPAGPPPRLQGFPQVTPGVQTLLITLGLALTLFFVIHAFNPDVLIVESQLQRPWATLDAIFLSEPHWQGGPPISYEVIFAETMYVFFGSLFLSVWLWRERDRAQRHYLDLGAFLLGLAAFGAFLGLFAWEDREMAVRIINLFLPAVVQPWLVLLVCGSSMALAGLLEHFSFSSQGNNSPPMCSPSLR